MLHSSPPAKILLPFAASGLKNTIPVASQIGATPGAASFTDGFPPLTMTPLASGGIPPSGGDFNGILNAITAIQQWQSAGGFFPYDVSFASQIGGYPMGAQLVKADGTGFWINQIDGNSSNPDTGGPGWIDNNMSPTRPTADNSDNNASTAFVHNVVNEAALGGGTQGGPFAPQTNPAGGVNNYAPKDSPAFTGTPTVPTAAATALSSQQAASLAYVQSVLKTPGSLLPGNRYTWAGGGSNYTNGYQTLPGGFMIQWGATAPAVNPSGVTTSFNVAFPNYCMCIVGTSDFNNAIINIDNNFVSSYFRWSAVAPGGGAAGSVSLVWMAIGF